MISSQLELHRLQTERKVHMVLFFTIANNLHSLWSWPHAACWSNTYSGLAMEWEIYLISTADTKAKSAQLLCSAVSIRTDHIFTASIRMEVWTRFHMWLWVSGFPSVFIFHCKHRLVCYLSFIGAHAHTHAHTGELIIFYITCLLYRYAPWVAHYAYCWLNIQAPARWLPWRSLRLASVPTWRCVWRHARS